MSGKMNRRDFMRRGAILGGSALASSGCQKPLQLFDKEIDHPLQPSEKKKQELMETGDKQLNKLVQAYVEYLEAKNTYHLQDGIFSMVYKHIENHKYEKFKEIDQKLGFELAESSFLQEAKIWENLLGKKRLGFVRAVVDTPIEDEYRRGLSNIIFGRVVDKEENKTYQTINSGEKVYTAIQFEPIVLPYLTVANKKTNDNGFLFNEQAYEDLAMVRYQCKRFKRWYDKTLSVFPEEKMNFEMLMAKKAYLLFEQMAKENKRAFEDEFVEMHKRNILGIHEPQHFETPNTEESSFWAEAAKAESEAEQCYSLASVYMPFKSVFLTEKIENQLLNSDFEGRKDIASEILPYTLPCNESRKKCLTSKRKFFSEEP